MSRNRWHLPGAALFVGLLGLGAWECTGSSDADTVAVPRPTAYPRIDIYPSSYTTIGVAHLAIEVNDSAVLADKEHFPARDVSWIRINYPRYNADLYCTYTPITHAAPLDMVLANREERMALNSGGASSELTEWLNDAGIACRMLITKSGTVTPVQYIATDSAKFVLSGALYMHGLDKAPDTDSIAPVVRAVEADVLHLLQNLHQP